MKKLEFLLQKEGDRAWLPLETPDVEILEGRYRVVARIPHPNADIEIRVTYTSFDEVSPQRQAQSRSARTNAEGLVVIIPYTRLKPGIWELSCLPDPQSQPAKPWQHGVQLEVLPVESETPAPLQPEAEDEPDSFAPAAAAAAPAAAASSIAWVAAGQLPANQASAAKPEPPSPKIYEFPSPPAPQPQTAQKLQLILDRETFVAGRGRPLIVSGKIDLPQAPGNSKKPPIPISDSQAAQLKQLIGCAQLQIYLRDPQTSQVLAEIQQPMPEQVPPCIFACVTYIPADCQSRLILGEAILVNGSDTIASKFFTITAGLERLLEAIEDNFGESKPQAEPPPKAPKPPKPPAIPTNLSFLNLVAKSLDDSQAAAPSATEALPPQLNPRPTERASNGLDLPAFGNKLPESSRAKMLSEISNQPQTQPSSIDSLSQPSESPNPLETAEKTPLDPKPENNPEPEKSAPETDPAPTKQAFQTLNVQNRFWSRLSSLASNGESPEWLKAISLSPTPKAAENSSDTAALVPDISSAAPQPPETDQSNTESEPTSPESKEFVIFDEPSPPPKKAGTAPTTAEAQTTPLTPYILPEDESVPMPLLELPRQEILAGRAVKVRVQLPELMPRIYVKIWVYDRQTYLILDGPHWIAEFKPNGLGKVQATVELEIPYGCMEVEFEAIAVEMQTQRESHKVTVHRQVLPPSGPTLPLDA